MKKKKGEGEIIYWKIKRKIYIFYIERRIEINRKYSIATITRCYNISNELESSSSAITQRNIYYRAISLKRSPDFCTSIIISRVSPWRKKKKKKLGRDLEQEWKRLKFGSKGTVCCVTQAAERKLPHYFFILQRRVKEEKEKERKNKLKLKEEERIRNIGKARCSNIIHYWINC